MRDEDWIAEMGAACCDCRFFEEAVGGVEKTIGRCHRFPPREWFEEVEEAVWPRVASYQYCGEFELEPERRLGWNKHQRGKA